MTCEVKSKVNYHNQITNYCSNLKDVFSALYKVELVKAPQNTVLRKCSFIKKNERFDWQKKKISNYSNENLRFF